MLVSEIKCGACRARRRGSKYPPSNHRHIQASICAPTGPSRLRLRGQCDVHQEARIWVRPPRLVSLAWLQWECLCTLAGACCSQDCARHPRRPPLHQDVRLMTSLTSTLIALHRRECFVLLASNEQPITRCRTARMSHAQYLQALRLRRGSHQAASLCVSKLRGALIMTLTVSICLQADAQRSP